MATTVGITAVEDRTEQLVRHGEQVRGSVVDADGHAGVLIARSKRIVVEFTYAGRARRAGINLDDSSPSFVAGQPVTVYVDRADPNHLTIDGTDNQSPWTLAPMIVGIVAGFLVPGVGVALLRRSRRWRRALSSGPWRAETIRTRVVPLGRTVQVIARMPTPDGGEADYAQVSVWRWQAAPFRDDTPKLWWTCRSDDRITMVAAPGGANVSEFRRPRRERTRRQITERFDG